MSLVLQFIQSRQWAILEEYLGLIAAIADRDLDGTQSLLHAIEKEWGKPVPNTRATTIRNGVAIIPVTGPLLRYGNIFSDISGATSFERLAADIGTVMQDPDVSRVIYDINSPGGEVDGVSETAELIHGFRGVKPQTAFVSHLGTSAAYWLAAATDEIIISQTSMVGSVGAILSVIDRTAMDEARGIKRMEFVSSVSPDKRLDPFSSDTDEATRAKAKIQSLVDRIGSVFLEVVAGYRGIGEEQIAKHKGGILLGPDAVEGGLADGVGTLEGLIEQYSSGEADGVSALPMSAAASGLTKHLQEALEMDAQENVAEVTIDLDFLASDHPDLLQEIRVAAATEERERILKIHALEAAGFDDLKLKMMKDPDATAGTAAEAILAARGEQEKRRVEAVEAALEADEKDIEEVASATLPPDDGESEEQAAASVIRFFGQPQHNG